MYCACITDVVCLFQYLVYDPTTTIAQQEWDDERRRRAITALAQKRETEERQQAKARREEIVKAYQEHMRKYLAGEPVGGTKQVRKE